LTKANNERREATPSINKSSGKPGLPLILIRKDYPPILNTLVPQFGHTPFFAFLPFFMVTDCSSFMVTFFLHRTQYASVIVRPPYANMLAAANYIPIEVVIYKY
jgi:hypothetical protein